MKYSKNIIVIGSKGMLGHMVTKCFNEWGYEVTIFDARFDFENLQSKIKEVNVIPDGVVVNCIGKINQKLPSQSELIFSNVIIPSYLASNLKVSHLLVHPSTDCIFSGSSNSMYQPEDHQDATDLYGITKSVAERAVIVRENSIVLRGSIIGPHPSSSSGLMQWFLGLPDGAEIFGYSNHFWNGVTTLQWCKNLKSIIEDGESVMSNHNKKIFQIGTEEIYSKYEMLLLFQKIFGTKVQIKEQKKDYIYRCLKPDIINPALAIQLKELLIEYYT